MLLLGPNLNLESSPELLEADEATAVGVNVIESDAYLLLLQQHFGVNCGDAPFLKTNLPAVIDVDELEYLVNLLPDVGNTHLLQPQRKLLTINLARHIDIKPIK